MASEISQMSDSSIVIIQGTVGLYTVATRCHTCFAVTLKYTEDSSLTIFQHSLTTHCNVTQISLVWCVNLMYQQKVSKGNFKDKPTHCVLSAKIQGMSEVSKVHAAWYPATLYKYYVKGVERNKIIINEYLRLHLRLLFVMSEVSKVLYTQMNIMKPQILQWLPHYLI